MSNRKINKSNHNYLHHMDMSAFEIGGLENADKNETHYWLRKNYQDRFTALEILRQRFFGYNDKNTPRIQRVLEITVQV